MRVCVLLAAYACLGVRRLRPYLVPLETTFLPARVGVHRGGAVGLTVNFKTGQKRKGQREGQQRAVGEGLSWPVWGSQTVPLKFWSRGRRAWHCLSKAGARAQQACREPHGPFWRLKDWGSHNPCSALPGQPRQVCNKFLVEADLKGQGSGKGDRAGVAP